MRRLIAMLTIALAALGGTATPSLAGGGGGCHGDRQELTSTRVDIQQFCFTQTVVHIAPGSSVTWTNYDETPHSVTDSNSAWGDYADIATSRTVTHTFDTPGVYPYFCYLHPGMVGAVVVDEDASATKLAASTPISSDRDGGSTVAWVVGGALLGLAAVFVTGFVVTRRRTPVVT